MPLAPKDKKASHPGSAGSGRSLTSRLIKTLPDSVQLSFELRVLDSQSTVGVLQEDFQVLDSLVPRQQFPFRDPSFLLERGVLVHQLN